MSDETETPRARPVAVDKAKPATKRATTKRSTSPVDRYLVADGRALSVLGRIIEEGAEVSADDVADIEALLKRGYVVKA